MKAEAAKPPGAGIIPKPYPRKGAAEIRLAYSTRKIGRREETVIRAACGFLRSFTQRPTPLPLVLLAEAQTVRFRSQ